MNIPIGSMPSTLTNTHRKLARYVGLMAMASNTAFAAQADLPSPTAGLFQVVFGLVIVLGVMALVAWVVKRIGPANQRSTSVLRIVGGVSVGSRERVLVLEVADRWLVVGVAPGQITSIANVDIGSVSVAPDVAQGGQPINTHAVSANPFAQWLKQAIGKTKS